MEIVEQLESFDIPGEALFKLITLLEWIDEKAPDGSVGMAVQEAIIAGKTEFITLIQNIADSEGVDLFRGTAKSLATEFLELWPLTDNH